MAVSDDPREVVDVCVDDPREAVNISVDAEGGGGKRAEVGVEKIKVTHKDCDWSFSRASGNGGQGVNKSNSKVHCKHRASGAHGSSQETRSQSANKGLAFMAMARTPEFTKWVHREVSRLTGKLQEIDEAVAEAMRPKNIRCEIRTAEGTWVETDLDLPLAD